MNPVRARWQRIAVRIDAMSLRERALIFAALAVALVMLASTLLLDPLARHDKAQQAAIIQMQANTAALQAQVQTLVNTYNADPDAALRARLQRLREASQRSGKTLAELQNGLVPPQRMTALLEDLMTRHRALHLVALKTLAPTNLLEDATATDKPSPEIARLLSPVLPAGIVDSTAAAKVSAAPVAVQTPAGMVYRHGVEVTISGSYLDLMAYLNALEALPWHMFWGRVELDAEQYPKVNLTLRLYTLSLDAAWLAL